MSELPTKAAVEIARRLTGGLTFRKRLPPEFGSASIFVTSRADIRLLAPGWKGPGGDLMQVVDRYVKTGMTIWDVGANLGILSFCAAFRASPSGRVFSIEADPKYAEIQNRTARTLPPEYAPVVPLCAAVSDKMSLLSLVVPKNGHARNHLSTVGGNSADSVECEKAVVAVTLDFLRQFWPAPQFLKIDVEGAELMALQGANTILRDDRPIIYVEVNEENSPAVTELLKSCSYALFAIDAEGRERPIDTCSFNTLAKPTELIS